MEYNLMRFSCVNVLATQTNMSTVDGSMKILLKEAKL